MVILHPFLNGDILCSPAGDRDSGLDQGESEATTTGTLIISVHPCGYLGTNSQTTFLYGSCLGLKGCIEK